MKLTPEQKAFYEYGKAVANLSFAREFLKLNPSELKKYEDPVLREQIVCRAWQVKERYCGNCKYSDYSEWDVPCCECSHANIVASIDRWEPERRASE